MNICPAQKFDIDTIMMIERASFIPSIQEKQSVFEERLEVFPGGFFILSDNSPETIHRNKKAMTAGYFCSEILDFVPGDDDFFTLGHSAKKIHNPCGKVLYITSFALFPHYRGKGNGTEFFEGSLKAICGAQPDIQTLLLLVNEEWTDAAKIYEKLGFKELRKLPGFFPSLQKEKSDGILMAMEAKFL